AFLKRKLMCVSTGLWRWSLRARGNIQPFLR
ncbi:MAG: hypothetical protein ACI9US_004406, partial [Gammaproteobacteria bacterium]